MTELEGIQDDVVRLYDVSEGIKGHVGIVPSLKDAQSNEDLKGGFPDLPMIQVYPRTLSSERITYGGVLRLNETQFHVDAWIEKLRHFGQSMALATNVLDDIQERLEETNEVPYFGIPGIQAFNSFTGEILTPSIRQGAEAEQFVLVKFVLDISFS